ncbi:sigma-54-dependent transcriptional regulator FlbD [Magnetospirillum gryphiswaldense]|uniref:Two-component response regulator n=1 Tax=Magnetospirillum gryphiswaldense TaxID=55518 RepID=A4TUG5_9PROT|nr:sigma-54 dependent transcriptional regulator [Magnetospirillum gryphiswaldense]AVM75227.1 Transcriptional regulatory protein ZraR [Magnetospirillum gryphiswaldense MSR-1]AVM79130.1 Transcriptional regulatory protein ZraR [Magnetospirillum gryphiswaldense]CAM74272.1 two-component response regulator [Magnetospirillum gryphiswaldense MSR-1]
MRLLIIGAMDGQIGAASQIAMARGAKVSIAEDVDQGMEVLRGQGADLVMIDVRRDVHRLIECLESERIVLPVIACGIASDASAAVRAIKAGAKEYIPLPPDAELIAAVLAAVTDENHAIIYKDPRMIQTMKLAEQVAGSHASILVTGESGTGKELMARFIHNKSPRAKGRFVAVNCAAIPENLLESELFGHEKGAFTGAVARRIGKFEEATGGTLLLDEISEMDIRLQAKLLRAIQEKEIDRVGGGQPVKIDVRIVATSNRNLEEYVRQGGFREDLYYRLNVVNLILPSLRERPLDIAVLADHFGRKYAEINGVPARPITPEARQMLVRHSWRGNVRELENTMHRAVLLASGNEIGPEAILLTGAPLGGQQDPVVAQVAQVAQSVMGGNTSGLVGKTVAAVERDLIIDTLSHCLGNRTHAANILGISIRTLRNKLKQYSEEGVPVPPPAGGEPAY